MKQQFIEQLKDSHIPYHQHQEFLLNIPADEFKVFDEDFITPFIDQPHLWQADYYFRRVNELEFYFFKETVEHIIEVKKYLQEQKVDARFLPKKEASTPFVEHTCATTVSQTVVHEPLVKSTVVGDVNTKTPQIKPTGLAQYEPNGRLIALLKENNVNRVRTLLMSMLTDFKLSIEDILKTIWYVHEKYPMIYDQLNEEDSVFVKPIDDNQQNWTEDYFNLQQVYLNRSFTFQRLLHLLNVRVALAEQGHSQFQQVNSPQVATETKPKVLLENEKSKLSTSDSEIVQKKQSIPLSQEHSQSSHSVKQPSVQGESQRKPTEQKQVEGYVSKEPQKYSKPSSHSEQYQSPQYESQQKDSFVKTLLIVGGTVLLGAIVLGIVIL